MAHPLIPEGYAPVTALHHARRDDDPDSTIQVSQGQAVLYAGALLTCFASAITCGVACIAIWIQVHA